MKNQIINQDILTDILYDTWEIEDGLATWYIVLSLDFTDFSAQEINAWYRKTLIETINSFPNFTGVSKVYFRASPNESDESIEIEWQSGTSYQKYYESVLNAIEDFPFTISLLEISADFYIFTRTTESPLQPVRGWVRYLGRFSFCGAKFHSNPFIYLNMNNTLFCPSDIYGGDNTELYSLNQPLLENALRNWEQKIGKIN